MIDETIQACIVEFMATLTCSEVADLLPALALDALDNGDRVAVLAHINTCSDCRQIYHGYVTVAEGLLGATPQRIAPSVIKNKLMATIRSSKLHSTWRDRLSGWLSDTNLTPRWVFISVVAAFVILVSTFGIQTLRLSSEQQVLATQLSQQQLAIALLVGSNTVSVSMSGTQQANGATAVMRYDPQDKLAVLQVRDLPVSSPGKAYQFWLIDADGKRDSGAVFTVAPEAMGKVTVVVFAPRLMKSYVRCGVSIEPAGGSPQPTGPTALTGKYWS